MKTKSKGLFNRYSNKKGINLVRHEKAKHAFVTIVLGLLVIAALSYAVARFGVIAQYDKLEVARDEYDAVHAQYLSTVEQLQPYDDVLREYRLYSKDWMEDESGGFVSIKRTEILDMIEQYMMTDGDITTINIVGNEVAVLMSGMSLTEVSNMCDELEQLDIVEYAYVTNAETVADGRSGVDSNDYELYLNNKGEIQVNAEEQSQETNTSQQVTPSNNSDALEFVVIIQLRPTGEEN